uniref:Transposase, mutator type n=1 Tax=Tanacetum cinerariifolium TaxID=118510 RepID=A0A6L2N4Z0_TANCI|nr:transposase, mutator type [Tanacetum cinerariifolium]
MLCEWRVRKKGRESNPYEDYRDFPSVFCLKINHGGTFTTPPKSRYKGGKINWVDDIDSDIFSIVEVTSMMEELGYENPCLAYYYKKPNIDLDNGLTELAVDKDVCEMLMYVDKFKKKFEAGVSKQKVFRAKNIAYERVVGRAKSNIMLNNMCEVLNRQLVDGRDKPIITCLEYIREYLIKRIVNVQKAAAKLKVDWNGSDLYQVTCPWGDQFVVNMSDRLSTWKEMYRFKINPINGPYAWKKSDVPTTIILPKPHPQIGRPPKKRKKSAAELANEIMKSNKMTRSGKSVTCSSCKRVGHNQRGCKSKKSGDVGAGSQGSGDAGVGGSHTT